MLHAKPLSHVRLCVALWYGLQATRLLCPWHSPDKNNGMGCHALLQGTSLTQGWNPCLISPVLAGGSFITSATWEATSHLVPHFSSVQLLSRVRLFVTPWTAARQASLSITNSQSLPKLMSIESVMPFNHLFVPFSVVPFSSCLQSFPTSRSFQMSQLFASGGQNIGLSASASFLPKKSQG